MTLDELELEFDIQYNNITSNQAPGLTPLEKSIFLTQAQEAVVKAYYGETNGFEKTEEIAEYLRTLVKQVIFDTEQIEFTYNNKKHTAIRYEAGDEQEKRNDGKADDVYRCWKDTDCYYTKGDSVTKDTIIFDATKEVVATVEKVTDKGLRIFDNGINKSALFCDIPKKLMFITYESANLDSGCNNIESALVVPVKQDEFFRIYNNPFRGPSKTRVLRLLNNDKIELVSKYPINQYLLRYIEEPEPIVLNGAADEEVDPYKTYPEGNTCKLPASVHRTIVAQAVALAKAAWGGK